MDTRVCECVEVNFKQEYYYEIKFLVQRQRAHTLPLSIQATLCCGNACARLRFDSSKKKKPKIINIIIIVIVIIIIIKIH